jgi:ribonuclease E
VVPAEAGVALEPAATPAASPMQAPDAVLSAPPAAERAAPGPAAAAPVPAPARAAAQPYHLPVETLATMVQAAGLEWVQSDAARISAVQAVMAAEPAPARVPREPRRQVLVDEGPLVLVETRKDLAQMKLPFDLQPAGEGAAASPD